MKFLIAFIIILSSFPSISQGMEIDCWSDYKNIYHGIGQDVFYGDGFLFFKEPSTGKSVYVYGDCLVKFYAPKMEKKKHS